MENNAQTKVTNFKSPNMNYIFNVEYFDRIQEKKPVSELNEEICSFSKFDNDMKNGKPVQPFSQLEDYPGYKYFDLYTEYPGLLMGLGNLHDISEEGAYKLGFSFDYVNGQPYLPGSSLKGLLRSVFLSERKENIEEYADYLVGLLGEVGITDFSKDQLKELEYRIFGSQDGKPEDMCARDVFLGAYPVPEKSLEKAYMGTEYVTPHKDKTKNPNPISLIKVKPNVCFRFSFLLYKDGKFGISAEQKQELFKRIILELGAGAKTNVGFGKFASQPTRVSREIDTIKRKIEEDKRKREEQRSQNSGYHQQNKQSEKGGYGQKKPYQQRNNNQKKSWK